MFRTHNFGIPYYQSPLISSTISWENLGPPFHGSLLAPHHAGQDFSFNVHSQIARVFAYSSPEISHTSALALHFKNLQSSVCPFASASKEMKKIENSGDGFLQSGRESIAGSYGVVSRRAFCSDFCLHLLFNSRLYQRHQIIFNRHLGALEGPRVCPSYKESCCCAKSNITKDLNSVLLPPRLKCSSAVVFHDSIDSGWGFGAPYHQGGGQSSFSSSTCFSSSSWSG
ncbi:hypothetical protein JCM33374_g2190 [Metschnikowia sp. JCM 33374]|nr:hypothetical protein JCM33374_g2190 [Metschnikowia sp. JCM 33374]